MSISLSLSLSHPLFLPWCWVRLLLLLCYCCRDTERVEFAGEKRELTLTISSLTATIREREREIGELKKDIETSKVIVVVVVVVSTISSLHTPLSTRRGRVSVRESSTPVVLPSLSSILTLSHTNVSLSLIVLPHNATTCIFKSSLFSHLPFVILTIFSSFFNIFLHFLSFFFFLL